MNFRKINNLVGWITFAIATIVYLVTMEPTVSFWDCGEFISCAYKVEVGHSPGAPLFMLIQRFFGILAGGNVEKVAAYINAWSALASSGTILFLFWTITHFAKRLMVGRDGEPQGLQTILIMGAGLVGGLAYTFSDTFWFSAVEAEVYATSSFFTALVFWAILKWEHVADQKYADRWLVFIAYMMGLSVGIHLLNLLAIPAVGMVYYYRRYEATRVGAIIAFFVSCAFLGLIQVGVLQWVPSLAAKFDLLFVNSLHLPFDSGAITFILLFVALMIWALMYARRKNKYLLHTTLLSFLFIVIGFSSYLAPIIRSRADLPIDMTNPDNAMSLLSYLKREQFGSQPLLFGQDFTSRPTSYNTTGHLYTRSTKDGKDYYEEVGDKIEQVFDASDKRFFPRIWDGNDPSHVQFYKNYLGIEGNDLPTSADNFKYFFNYQIDWMWWRYFMWNYAGRQNDFEGQGGPKDGNWISGIKFVDKNVMGRGDLDVMGDGYSNNRARNQFYFLPLILGLMGMVYQFNRNRKDGIVTMVLFFFTGIAIAIYLNMPPLQPRERDYAFVGSMYAFAIWIGLGVLMVNELLQRAVKNTAGAVVAIGLCLLAVPALMAKEGWDDHDRSKKTLARASAYNVLMSCEPNAILFTFGDNDTYPLWYLQEVEGVRPDIRLINMSLLGIDWYIDQLNYKVNNADAVPMLWKKEHYIGDRRNYMMYYKSPQVPQDRYFNLVDICKFITSDDQNSKIGNNMGEFMNYFPTKNFFLPVPDKAALVQNGLIKATDTTGATAELKFTLPKEIAYKDDLAVLNILAGIAQEGWKRPIYFGGGLPADNYIGLDNYLRLEGLVYRVVPYSLPPSPMAGQVPGDLGTVDLQKSYDLFMNKYQWGNAQRNDVYFDEKNRIMFSALRLNAGRIAMELSALGRNQEAIAILDKVKQNISERSYLYDATAYYMAVAYYRAGAKDKGREIAKKLVRNSEADLNYVLTLNDNGKASMVNEVQRDLTMINVLGNTATASGDTETGKEFSQKVEALAAKMQQNMDLGGLQ